MCEIGGKYSDLTRMEIYELLIIYEVSVSYIFRTLYRFFPFQQ
jgi:hypothetical protein